MHLADTVTLIVAFTVTSLMAQQDNVDVTILSKYLEDLKEDTLGVGNIQAKVNNLEFQSYRRNGSMIVNQLAASISTSIAKHIRVVQRLKSAIEKDLDVESNRKWTPCCEYEDSLLQQNENFLPTVDPNNLCQIIAPSAPENLQSLPSSIQNVMMENRRINPSVKWQYVATKQGLLTLFPAQKIEECSFIDARFRPWYIETVRTHRNNVLILLDVSRSMADRYNSVPLIDIAKGAVQIMLEILTPRDKIGIVAFNNTAVTPGGCFKDGLTLATEDNIKTMNKSLDTFLPSGESVYTVGFQKAFELLHNTISHDNDTEGDWTILLITDGQPKEKYLDINKVYETIKAGNERISNRASIFAYGVGREDLVDMEILRKIADQNFDGYLNSSQETNASVRHQGSAINIDEPGNLRNVISLFNINHGRIEDTFHPVFSVPYVDGGGLGLIFTVGLPILQYDNSLFGVAAVDIVLMDLFKDGLYFSSGQDSYVFVIDNTGRVIIHPLMPLPTDHNDSPNFIQIDKLERNQEFYDVLTSMKRREHGKKTFAKTEVIPIGNVIQAKLVNSTYFWSPIEETHFSICLVLRETSFEVTIPPRSYISLIKAGLPSFRYHRLDFEIESPDLCRRFYHKSTLTQSIIIFAPRCFEDPFLFLQREKPEFVLGVTAFFNQLLTASSVERIKQLIAETFSVSGLFVDGVIADVIWTTLVDELWVNNNDVHLANRYVGTRSGVVRLYPGAMIRGGYDPTARVWYELAVANPGLFVITPPYVDGAGAGNVITLSQTITKPSRMASNSETFSSKIRSEELGVMGVDFLLDYLYSELQSLYPNCEKPGREGWHCLLVDNRGNIILHPEYASGNQQNSITVKHIASDASVMEKLRQTNSISRKTCLDLDLKVYRRWYELDLNTYVNNMDASNELDCNRFFMRNIPGTNVFLMARMKFGYCNVKNDCPTETNCGDNSEDSWQCPCTYPIQFDACMNTINLQGGVAPCFPERPPLGGEQECIPEYLRQCFDPKCENELRSSNCSSLVECTWCTSSDTGRKLPQPYCTLSEKCYNGLEGNRWSGYQTTDVCPAPITSISTLHLVVASIGGCVVLIALLSLAICCHAKLRRKRRTKEEVGVIENDSSNSYANEMNDPLTSPNGRASTPISPNLDSNESGKRKKASKAPIVMLSVLDADGSEIVKKRVQIHQGGKVYGATPSMESNCSDNHRRRPHSTPLLQRPFFKNRKRNDDSGVSSNNESGIHSNSTARPRTSSNLSEASAPFKATRPSLGRPLSVGHESSPSAFQNQDHEFQRNNLIRRPCRSRDNLSRPKENQGKDDTEYSGYTLMKSSSAANSADGCDITTIKALNATPSMSVSKSTSDLLNSAPKTRPSHYVKRPSCKEPGELTKTFPSPKNRHFSNPSYDCNHVQDGEKICVPCRERSRTSEEEPIPIFV